MHRNVLYRATRLAVAALLAIMALLILKEVIFRYVFAAPAFWTEELARYVMFYMVLLGSSIAIREERHPALLFVIQNFSPRFRRIWRIFIDVLIFAVLVAVFREGLVMAVDEIITRTPALRVSFFWIYLALPLGSLLMMIQIIAKHVFGKESTARTEDASEGSEE